jgi:hypothetical protein
MDYATNSLLRVGMRNRDITERLASTTGLEIEPGGAGAGFFLYVMTTAVVAICHPARGSHERITSSPISERYYSGTALAHCPMGG